MDGSKEPMYVIPARYRNMENLHIVFWLIKDISWCMIWKSLGLAMAIPTLTIAIIISWRTRNIKSELAHNLAITFWILANACWMVSEFYHFDTITVWGGFEGKHLALIPFATGVLILLNYYLLQKPKESRATQIASL
jgi:hypothetical protein